MKLLSERLLWAIERERTRRNGKRVTKAELARVAGVSDTAAGNWLKGDHGMDAPKARAVAAHLRVDPLWLETGEGAPTPHSPAARPDDSEVEDAPRIVRSRQTIPVVGRVQAGTDGLLHIDDFSADHPDGFLDWYATCEDAYALRIRGESMSPRYLPGEFVGVDPCGEAQPSDEVIVLLKDGRRLIKRLLWVRDDQACFESVNKDHPNIIIDCAEIDGMHLVLGHIPKIVFRPNV
jgi:phage repressor protein C with HTH and peptisase S24 domain